jgi:hypothetical protein
MNLDKATIDALAAYGTEAAIAVAADWGISVPGFWGSTWLVCALSHRC